MNKKSRTIYTCISSKSENGFALFTTLMLLGALAVMFTIVQTQLTKTSILLAKLEDAHKTDLKTISTYENSKWALFTSAYAETPDKDKSIKLDGNISVINVLDDEVKVQFQDTLGLVDINYTNPSILMTFLNTQTNGDELYTKIMDARSKGMFLNPKSMFMNNPSTHDLTTNRAFSRKLSVENTPTELLQLLSGSRSSRTNMIETIGLENFNPQRAKLVRLIVLE